MSLKFNVTLDRDEDGAWVVECPAIPGCVSQGGTREEALVNIEDAIGLCLEVRAELGMLLTHWTRLAMRPRVETRGLEVPTVQGT